MGLIFVWSRGGGTLDARLKSMMQVGVNYWPYLRFS